jgi:hypothetical protein
MLRTIALTFRLLFVAAKWTKIVQITKDGTGVQDLRPKIRVVREFVHLQVM